jgi:hypothetical protein
MMALQTKNKVSTTLSRMSKKELLNLLTKGWGFRYKWAKNSLFKLMNQFEVVF